MSLVPDTFASTAEAREIVRNSFERRTFTPQYPDAWHEPLSRFVHLSSP
jgi:hypothetical protein